MIIDLALVHTHYRWKRIFYLFVPAFLLCRKKEGVFIFSLYIFYKTLSLHPALNSVRTGERGEPELHREDSWEASDGTA